MGFAPAVFARTLRCALLLVSFGPALLITQSANGQSPAGPASPQQRPVRPKPPAMDQEQAIAYWTSETGWMSELQLRNNLMDEDLAVTPTLRLADGAEVNLAAVTIKPHEVKSVDLNSAIVAAAAPQLVGTYGSVALRYRSFHAGNLYAAVMVHNIGHPFAFHIDAIGQDPSLAQGSREGVWWLQSETSTDYLVITNHGDIATAVDLSLYGANGKEANREPLLLGPHEMFRYSIRKLVRAAGIKESYGGIKISSAHAGSLDTLHVLFDEGAGFSAVMKMFDHNSTTTLDERDFAKTGVGHSGHRCWPYPIPIRRYCSRPQPSFGHNCSFAIPRINW